MSSTASPTSRSCSWPSAQGIVDQGLEGLQSGAVTPSQYLQAVRFVDDNGASAPSPANSPSSLIVPPPVAVVTSAQDRQQAILQNQVLQAELRQQGLTPIDPERFTGPLTQAQADLLTQTGYLFSDTDAARVAQLRDQGQLFSLGSVTTLGMPLAFGSLAEAAAELYGAASGAGGIAGCVLVASGEMLASLALIVAEAPLAALTLLVMPGNVGKSQPVYLNEDQRFVTRAGERYGNLEERDVSGDWQVSKSNASLVSLGSQRVAAFTDEELRQLIRPLTTPGTPLPPRPPLINVPPSGSNQQSAVPGMLVDQPAGPIVETYPADPPMSWEDLIIENRDSKKLGDALRAAGINPPVDAEGIEIPGYQAHHVVPTSAGGAAMADLRARLQGMGIDLNSEINGVWLPGSKAPDDATGAYHPRLNNDVYDDAVLKLFKDVNDRITAERTLGNIAEDLRNGTFPGVRPRP